jgi:hypothetical protein
MELTNILDCLGVIAYLAKDSGETNLFNQVKDQYQSLANKWYTQAKSEADRKSYKNWLGGGESYSVISPTKFENAITSGYTTFFNQLSKGKRIQALRYLLRVKQFDFNTLTDAYTYAEKSIF